MQGLRSRIGQMDGKSISYQKSAVWLYAVLLLQYTVNSGSIRCRTAELPVVRQLNDIPQNSYGRSGLSHMTIFGAIHHGMKEVEVWLQTFAPGSGTPIHRHSCEEVFLVLKGGGTLYLATEGEKNFPGEPNEFKVSINSTFTVPMNVVHQLKNTDDENDLQVLVIISRPPIKVFTYKDWLTSHTVAEFVFPYPWDAVCLENAQEVPDHHLVSDEL